MIWIIYGLTELGLQYRSYMIGVGYNHNEFRHPMPLTKIRTFRLSLLSLILVLPVMAQGQAQTQRLGTEFGMSAFERECTKCHGNAAVDRAPSPAAIRQMPPERIYAAITTGIMQTQAANLTDEQKRRLAEYMGGRPLGSAELGDASQMPNRCPAGSTLPDLSKSAAWNGWGVDTHNTRFQSAEAAGLTRRADSQPETEMGVWIPAWRFGVRTAVDCRRPRVCRLRYWLCLLARHAHRLRALVVSGEGGRAHGSHDRAGQRSGLVPVRRLFRGHAGERLLA